MTAEVHDEGGECAGEILAWMTDGRISVLEYAWVCDQSAKRADARHLMSVGEEKLAFDTMCSWIYEDALPITRDYYMRLVSGADELATQKSVRKLDELIEDGDHS